MSGDSHSTTMPDVPSRTHVEPLVRELIGANPERWVPVFEGGYTPAARWIATWRDGRSAFIKAAFQSEHSTGLALEGLVCEHGSASCLPRFYGYMEAAEAQHDGQRVQVLITEDLSGARWGVPLVAEDARALAVALDELATVPVPTGVPSQRFPSRWIGFADDPHRLAKTGLAPEAWIEAHAPALAAAEAAAEQEGSALTHWDLWLQNWCRADRGAVLVDWSACGRANIMVSRAWGEAGIRAAGGPPGHVLAGEPAWAAWMAGHAAEFLAGTRGVPQRLVETQRREAMASLAWACEELQLPVPEPSPGFHPGWPWRP